MPEQALVGGDADTGALDLAFPGLPELPVSSHTWRSPGRARPHRTHQGRRRVDGKAAADLGDAVAQELSASPSAQKPSCSYQSSSRLDDRS